MPTTIHYSNCLLCKSTDFKQLHTVKDYTVSLEEFKVLACQKCGFRFTQGVPTQATIGSYYASENYISHSDTQEGMVNKLYHFARNYMLNAKVKLAQKFNSETNKNLLDIGTGTGYYANAMQQKGWQVSGIEADEGARKSANSNFNLAVKDVTEFYNLPNNNFQTITMWHVLEHVHTLHEYIAQIHQLLTAEGTLIIAVPNSDCYDAKHYQAHWAGWDVPRHLYHFTPSTMKLLLEQHDFKIVKQKMMPFDPFYISMLSEKYKDASLSFLRGMSVGKLSFFKGFMNTKKASSVIYIAKKK